MHAAPGWITLFVFVGGTTMAGAGLLLGRRREFRGGTALSVHLAAVGAWTFVYGVSLGAPVAEAIAIRSAGQGLVIIGPSALVVFAARFTRRDAWLEPHGLQAIIGVAAFFVIAAFTNVGGLFLPHGRSLIDGTITEPGPVYLMALAVLTVWMLAASYWLLAYARHSQRVRRREAIAIVFGIVALWLGSGLTAAHVFPFGVDATTLALVVLAGSLAYAVLADRSAELLRKWQEHLVSTFDDGFLVADASGVILHGNEAALRLLQREVGQVRGEHVSDLFADAPDAVATVARGNGSYRGPVDAGVGEGVLSIDAFPVNDDRGRPLGTALHVRDAWEEFMDSLTGVGNRRYFFERAQHLLARVEHAGGAALALIDLDHLKHINDMQGHAGGDAALRGVSGLLRSFLPADTVLGRIGGDEFAVLMPGTTPAAACSLLDAIRIGVAAQHDTWSISAGVAAVSDGEALIAAMARADAALLTAKRLGRNRVEQHAHEDAGGQE